jgi:hypothetical protein
MNTGKEPFQCGMESAECGVRDKPIPAAGIADHVWSLDEIISLLK